LPEAQTIAFRTGECLHPFILLWIVIVFMTVKFFHVGQPTTQQCSRQIESWHCNLYLLAENNKLYA